MYAQVIVDLSSSEVDRLFTYAVPSEMWPQPGQQVEVPFGPRTLEGFVVSLTDETDVPPEKLKPLKRILTPEPVILPEMMELATWMRKRYHVTLVDALRLMIPAEMRGGRVHEKQVRVAALNVPEAQAREAMAKNRRAVKQNQVLEMLLVKPYPVPFLEAQLGGVSAAVRALADKGLIRIESDEVLRRPAARAQVERQGDLPLTPEQARAVDELRSALHGGGGRFLLNGVTGSGKTEVFIHVIREALRMGKGAIVLVPEIALTPQMVQWFQARFGDDAAVIHSRLSAGERFDEWRRIRRGDARVVVGARSAVFSPVENPGVIIVDEEHETSYLSDKRPRYDAREIAWRRMEQSGGVLILGSATPSISTYMRAMPGVKPENRLTLIEMNHRANGRPLPEVSVVDMRRELEMGNKSIFSGELAADMRRCLDEGHQAILFINRRGFSTFVSCRACGKAVKCPQCDVTLTYHQVDDMLRCHYCGYEQPSPKVCPECGSRYIKYFGAGTQKVEQEVKDLFPGVPVARMDVDTTQGKDMHQKILDAFRAGQTRVLVGTQMIAKGLDFPNVTLVGVVAADMSLNLPDYRSVERTFQLITQVAGRAGRAQYPGKVVVQTYDPEHYGIALAAKQDYRAFYHREVQFRRQGLYPPYTLIARIVYSAADEEKAKAAAQACEAALNALIDGTQDLRRDIVQMRAVVAPIKKLRGEMRWQVFLKMYSKGDTEKLLCAMDEQLTRVEKGVRAELEINPVNMI